MRNKPLGAAALALAVAAGCDQGSRTKVDGETAVQKSKIEEAMQAPAAGKSPAKLELSGKAPYGWSFEVTEKGEVVNVKKQEEEDLDDVGRIILERNRMQQELLLLSGQKAFKGIGVSLRLEKEQWVLAEVLPGSPAQGASLANGDVVLEIDGEKVAGKSADEVMAAFRGKEGKEGEERTKVTLLVSRGGEARTVEVPVKSMRVKKSVEVVEEE